MTAGPAGRLLYAPDGKIVILVVVAGDEGVLVAALGVDVVLGDQKRWLHEAARLLAVEGAVQFVDGLIGLQLNRLGDGDGLVLAAFADAVIGRAVAVGGHELHLLRIDAAAPEDGNGKVPVVVADGRGVERGP